MPECRSRSCFPVSGTGWRKRPAFTPLSGSRSWHACSKGNCLGLRRRVHARMGKPGSAQRLRKMTESIVCTECQEERRRTPRRSYPTMGAGFGILARITSGALASAGQRQRAGTIRWLLACALALSATAASYAALDACYELSKDQRLSLNGERRYRILPGSPNYEDVRPEIIPSRHAFWN